MTDPRLVSRDADFATPEQLQQQLAVIGVRPPEPSAELLALIRGPVVDSAALDTLARSLRQYAAVLDPALRWMNDNRERMRELEIGLARMIGPPIVLAKQDDEALLAIVVAGAHERARPVHHTTHVHVEIHL